MNKNPLSLGNYCRNCRTNAETIVGTLIAAESLNLMLAEQLRNALRGDLKESEAVKILKFCDNYLDKKP